MPVDNDNLIAEEEMFIMSFDTLKGEVPEDVAMARGDMPDEADLEKPVELILDEDKPEEDEEDVQVEPEKEEDPAAVEQEEEPAAEQAAEEIVVEAEPEKTTPVNVPYGRFSEKVVEINYLKQKIADLEAAQNSPHVAQDGTQAPAFDIKAKYQQYADLVADGETKEAAQVMFEIDQYKEQQSELRILKGIETSKDVAIAQDVVDDILQSHGEWFANQRNNQAFNRAKMAYMREDGMSLSQALTEAREVFFGERIKATAPTAPAIDAGKEKIAELKAAQQKKAIETKANAAKQPMSMNVGRSNRDKTADPAANALAIPEAEYKSMSLKQKRQNRGDFV